MLISFQIARALFPSIDYAQERLRKLTALAVLDRFRPQKPDGGSYPYHYVLAQLGVDVVAAQRGEDMPRRDHARRRRWHLTQRANLPHLLGTNGFFTDLAGHARNQTGCELRRWWSAARCQRMGTFAQDGDDVHVRAYVASVRPDGHGVWADHGRAVPFFLEYDTGTERPLSRLVDKLDGYTDLARVTGRVWPVLFWLHSAGRERRLHHLLAERGSYPLVATATYDAATATGGGEPARAVWWLYRHAGGPLRLAALADHVPASAAGRR